MGNFIPSSSAIHNWLQQWKHYWNRFIFDEVILKIKLALFYGSWCRLYSCCEWLGLTLNNYSQTVTLLSKVHSDILNLKQCFCRTNDTILHLRYLILCTGCHLPYVNWSSLSLAETVFFCYTISPWARPQNLAFDYQIGEQIQSSFLVTEMSKVFKNGLGRFGSVA